MTPAQAWPISLRRFLWWRSRSEGLASDVAFAFWLLFRLMFMSGVVKLESGDPTWRSLTALDYHYWTQPLPNPMAWAPAR